MKALTPTVLPYILYKIRLGLMESEWIKCSARDTRHHIAMAGLYFRNNAVVQEVLGQGVNISEVDSEISPLSPIYLAMGRRQYDLVRSILDGGLDANDNSRGSGQSLFKMAAANGQEYVELIFRLSMDANEREMSLNIPSFML
jgi:hypothetical protein